jgi:hypothetical protein
MGTLFKSAKPSIKKAQQAQGVPMAEDDELRRRQRRGYSQQTKRTGRSGTILSESDQLGP